MRQLGLSHDNTNVNGGAIAVATLLAALARVSSDFDARNEAARRGHAKATLLASPRSASGSAWASRRSSNGLAINRVYLGDSQVTDKTLAYFYRCLNRTGANTAECPIGAALKSLPSNLMVLAEASPKTITQVIMSEKPLLTVPSAASASSVSNNIWRGLLHDATGRCRCRSNKNRTARSGGPPARNAAVRRKRWCQKSCRFHGL